MTDEEKVKRNGKLLAAARHDKKLTQAQVAKKAGISENYYAQIERGLRNPSTTVFLDIIDAIGIDPNSVLKK